MEINTKLIATFTEAAIAYMTSTSKVDLRNATRAQIQETYFDALQRLTDDVNDTDTMQTEIGRETVKYYPEICVMLLQTKNIMQACTAS